MAEFLGADHHRRRALALSSDPRSPNWPDKGPQGWNAMGQPVPWARRQCAFEHCQQMGLSNKAQITYVVDAMSQALESDKPYEAMEAGMAFLDLTGTYRLMAVLLAG